MWLRAEVVHRVLVAVCLVQLVTSMRLLPGLVTLLSLSEASVLLPAVYARVCLLDQVKLPVPRPRPEPLDPLYERQRQSVEECSWDSPSSFFALAALR